MLYVVNYILYFELYNMNYLPLSIDLDQVGRNQLRHRPYRNHLGQKGQQRHPEEERREDDDGSFDLRLRRDEDGNWVPDTQPSSTPQPPSSETSNPAANTTETPKTPEVPKLPEDKKTPEVPEKTPQTPDKNQGNKP